GHTVEGAAAERVVEPITGNPHGVDAERGMQIVVEPQICRREADGPPAPIADRDPTVNFPASAEERRRLARLSSSQQLSDMSRGIDGRVIATHRLEHGHAEPVLLASRAQNFRIATTPVSKGAVPTHND